VRGRGRVPDPRGAFQAVLLELVRGVLNPFRGLRLRQRAVDAGRRLRAVASEERGLIQEKDAAAVLEDGVRGGQAREAAADDDDLFAHRARFTGASSTKAAAARERSARQLLTVKKVKVSPKAPGPVLVYGKSSQSKQLDDGLFTVQSSQLLESRTRRPGAGDRRERRRATSERLPVALHASARLPRWRRSCPRSRGARIARRRSRRRRTSRTASRASALAPASRARRGAFHFVRLALE
jgi:hypothetical protein